MNIFDIVQIGIAALAGIGGLLIIVGLIMKRTEHRKA